VLKEVESLEDHADLSSLGADLFVIALVQLRTSQLIAHEIAIHAEFASIMLL
jgi:hypothetical protein